jgi:6-phosphofructokinase 1
MTKTIDDDLLPSRYIDHTFGVDSASDIAGDLINTMAADAFTMPRWFLVRVMGRASGELALESAVKGGAHACFIPEQYALDQNFSVDTLAADIKAFMGRRADLGFNYGVVVISEGVEERILLAAKARGELIPEDQHGNPIQNLGIQNLVIDRMGGSFREARLQSVELGYELRASRPNKKDVWITSTEGRAAVKMLMRGEGGNIISIKDGEVLPVPFDSSDIFDTTDTRGSIYGKAVKRAVDVTGADYFLAKAILEDNAKRRI